MQKIDAYTVRFTLAQPYAAAERIFDSLAMMPRHLLEKAYREDRFTQVWNLNTPPVGNRGPGAVSAEAVCSGPTHCAGTQSVLLEDGSEEKPAALSR